MKPLIDQLTQFFIDYHTHVDQPHRIDQCPTEILQQQALTQFMIDPVFRAKVNCLLHGVIDILKRNHVDVDSYEVKPLEANDEN